MQAVHEVTKNAAIGKNTDVFRLISERERIRRGSSDSIDPLFLFSDCRKALPLTMPSRNSGKTNDANDILATGISVPILNPHQEFS